MIVMSNQNLLPGSVPLNSNVGPSSLYYCERRRRKKWSQELNIIVMECYYTSNPKVVTYKERMHMICKEKGIFDVKEQ